MKKALIVVLLILVVFNLKTYAIQIGPTEKCTKISTILYKSFITSNNGKTPVEIKLVTEDRRGEDIDVYAHRKHYELCDVFIEQGWEKKSFEVQEEMATSVNYVLLMKSDFECKDKNWEIDKRATDIILAIDGFSSDPRIKFFNYLHDKDELWNKKIQRLKDDKRFFNEMVI